jgi:hypothetical protein
MISINLSSIQKLASAILRQIHLRVSNFDRNYAVAPIRNRYLCAVSTAAQGTSGTSAGETGTRTSPNIHRPAQIVAASQPLASKKHPAKGRSLDFGYQHVMFSKNAGKPGWVCGRFALTACACGLIP